MDQSSFPPPFSPLFFDIECPLCLWCCRWLKILSMCWLQLLLFFFFFFLFCFCCFFLPHLDIHATAGVLWLWQLNAVHALHCLYFFPKELYCGLNCEVYWSVQTFFFVVVVFLFPLFCAIVLCMSLLWPHSSCCSLCLVHIKVCCGFQGNKKQQKKYHTFTVSLWDHNKSYFFSIMPFER